MKWVKPNSVTITMDDGGKVVVDTETWNWTEEKQMKDVNSNNVSDRRSASTRRESDITAADFPVITKTSYNSMCGDVLDGAVNLKMKRLAMGRIKLYQAKLIIDAAMTHFNPQVPDQKNPRIEDSKTYNALRSISTKLETMVMKYPLKIVNT